MASDGSRALFGLVYETKAGMDFGWRIGLVLWANSTGMVEAPQSPGLKRPQVQSDPLVMSAMVPEMAIRD